MQDRRKPIAVLAMHAIGSSAATYFDSTLVVNKGSFETSEHASLRKCLISLYYVEVSQTNVGEEYHWCLTFGVTPLSRRSLMTRSLSVLRLSTHSMSPHSSFSGVTANVLISSTIRMERKSIAIHLHMRRLLASTSFFRDLLIMLLNSMRRWSLRRSSFGLHRRLYIFPSEPRMLIFRGFCNEFNTCASSSTANIVSLR